YREAAAEHVELIGCRLHDEHRTVGGEGLLAPPVSRESGAEEIAAQRDSPRGTRAGEMQQQSAGRTVLLRLEERVAELAQRLIDIREERSRRSGVGGGFAGGAAAGGQIIDTERREADSAGFPEQVERVVRRKLEARLRHERRV